MKYLIYIFALSMSLQACVNHSSTIYSASEVELPALLQRPAIIGPQDEMGNLKDRYDQLVQTINDQPQVSENYLDLAELFMLEARVSGEHGHYFPAALKMIDASLKRNKNPEQNYRALLDKSSVLLSLHQFPEALAIAQKAVEINPYDAAIYGVMVDAYVELGNYAMAVEYADKMIGLRPDIRSYSRVSYLREIHGDIPGAIEAMELAVSSGYPGLEQTEWARLVLGNLYVDLGQFDKAQMQYERALNYRPNYPFAIGAIAELSLMDKNLPKAKSKFMQASQLIPEVGFYIELAKIAQMEGDEQRLKNLSTEILKMLAEDEASGHQMGLAYAAVHRELKQNYKEALKYAQAEYKVRPDNIEVNEELAKIYLAKKDFQKANFHLQKALKTNSQSSDLLDLKKEIDEKILS